ncbi:MAG: DUF2142 domain-containing protein [Chloroflexi bacterium]|nr:DUF2142 domain-containing protein [Chloroflexota bacterium]
MIQSSWTKIITWVKDNPGGAGATTLYLLLAVLFSVLNPIHEATDELRHFRYVRYIADFGELPVQSGEQGNAQAHHPPLYYASAALLSFWVSLDDPLYEPEVNPHWSYRNWEVSTDNKNLYIHGPGEAWPYRGASLASRVARWTAGLWGAGAVLLTYLIALAWMPGRKWLATGAALLIACNPMFAYLGGAVNNDVPAGLMGAAITFATLVMIRDGVSNRLYIWLGVMYALASLTKFNLVAMLGVIELALLATLIFGHSHQKRFDWLPEFFKANAIILGVTALLAGWWYVRNTILYGEPTGFLRVTELWGVRDPTESVGLALSELGYAWTSLWARFGYGQIPVPTVFYTFIGVVCGTGIVGMIIVEVRNGLNREHNEAINWQHWAMLAVLLSTAIGNFLVLYAYMTVSPAGAMGRFFFPGLPAFVVLVATGLFGLLKPAQQVFPAIALGVVMPAYAFATLLGYLVPAYQLPPDAPVPANALEWQVGETARILAYEVDKEEIEPGDPIDVTITWEVLQPTDIPYFVYIHLYDSQQIVIAQRDTYAGLGTYPTTIWEPGHVFTETYRLFAPDPLFTPDVGFVRVGLFHPERGHMPVDAPVTANDSIELAIVTYVPDPDEAYPNETYINWDDKFALVGFFVDPRRRAPNQQFEVRTYWKALQVPQDEDFKMFVQVWQDWERWASNDGNPVHPDGYTRYWEAGEVYVDVRRVVLPSDIPDGSYVVALGWFSDEDGKRLDIIGENGNIVDNWLPLSTIQVDRDG